jgi:hypothetical protein
MSPRSLGREMLNAPGVQSLTQIPQALQSSSFIFGFGQDGRFT